MSVDKSPNEMATEFLKELAVCMSAYSQLHDSLISKRNTEAKIFTSLRDQARTNLMRIKELNKQIIESKFEIDNLGLLMKTLIIVQEDLLTVAIGLSNKANRTKRYGFFRFRKDHKTYMESVSLYELSKGIFSEQTEKKPGHK